MTRGEIWWVNFGIPIGSGPGYRRPAVIVQNDNFNESNIQTTVVVPLSTNLLLAEFKDNLLLPSSMTKLPKDSVALAPQIGAVDKSCLDEKVSKLSPKIMAQITQNLEDLLQ